MEIKKAQHDWALNQASLIPPMNVNYSGLIGYLIESVKELSARIEELENK